MKLCLYGNRMNSFGAVHNADAAETWYGPNLWRTQEANGAMNISFQKWGSSHLRSGGCKGEVGYGNGFKRYWKNRPGNIRSAPFGVECASGAGRIVLQIHEMRAKGMGGCFLHSRKV